MSNKTRIENGYGNVLRKELELYIESVEGKELTDKELAQANSSFRRNFEALSSRVLTGAEISKAIQHVTEPEVRETGKQTEIKFGDQALASQMLMVAFD